MNLVRSIIVPHTIASETAQKTNSKNHFADAGAVLASIAGRSSCEPGLKVGKKPLPPMKAKTAAGAEGEAEADRPVGDRADAQVGDDLGDHGADVLHAAEADLEHREAGLHEHHEDRRPRSPRPCRRATPAAWVAVGVVGQRRDGHQRREQRSTAAASSRTAGASCNAFWK